MNNPTIIAGAFLIVLAIASVSVATNILLRGKIWRSLKPESRPRRWILILLLASLGMTFIWLPVFVIWPHTLFSRVLTIAWVVLFAGTGLSLKWLSGLIGMVYKRRTSGLCDS
jgi:archaellum biogenesis protein FlaJ (TadC family)